MCTVEAKHWTTKRKASSRGSKRQKHAMESIVDTFQNNCAARIGAQDIFAVFWKVVIRGFVGTVDSDECFFFGTPGPVVPEVDTLVATHIVDDVDRTIRRLIIDFSLNQCADQGGRRMFMRRASDTEAGMLRIESSHLDNPGVAFCSDNRGIKTPRAVVPGTALDGVASFVALFGSELKVLENRVQLAMAA